MRISTLHSLSLATLAAFGLAACDKGTDGPTAPEGCDGFVAPGDNDDEDVQTMFLDASDGDTVCLGEGEFQFTREMTISANDLVVKGAGQDKTTLDFSRQDLGGSGVKISGDGVTIAELTVQDTPGDGVFAEGVNDITFRDMTVLWTEMYGMDNGAYGVYPVNSNGVIVDGVTVSGARDAGIYVGQSNDIMVENSLAIDNVAGIEIENSFDAVVRNNEAYGNTGGVLVFNLPGLQQKNGERTLVHDNEVYDNNIDNWGVPGTAVAEVPRGTGVLILAADVTEVRNNNIYDHDSVAVVIVSYLLLDVDMKFLETDPEFDAYAERNYIHDNTIWDAGANPDGMVGELIPVDPVPPIAFDGCYHPDNDNTNGEFTNCLFQNVDSDGMPVGYFDLDVCGNFANQNQDIAAVTCQRDPL